MSGAGSKMQGNIKKYFGFK